MAELVHRSELMDRAARGRSIRMKLLQCWAYLREVAAIKEMAENREQTIPLAPAATPLLPVHMESR